MLGKLIKQEWKNLWKVPTLLLGILAISAILAGLTFALPIWDSEWVGLALSGILIIGVFYIAIIAAYLGVLIYTSVRFYRSMYTDEGYLTHTLPVTARQLLISKILVTSIWNLITSIAIVLSCLLFGFMAVFFLDSDILAEIPQALLGLSDILNEPQFRGWQGFLSVTVLMTLVSVFTSTIMFFSAISIGQLVRKHRILGAIGAYFGINFGLNLISTILMIPFFGNYILFFESNRLNDLSNVSIFDIYTPVFLITTISSLVISIGLYIISEYLVRRKLELE